MLVTTVQPNEIQRLILHRIYLLAKPVALLPSSKKDNQATKTYQTY